MKLNAERTARLARKLFRHVEAGTTDLTPSIKSFEASIYVDPDVAELEKERIFRVCPVAVAHAGQLRNPGDFLTAQMNDHDVLLTRQSDGSVGAFVNACRHRGATVVDASCGNRKTFTCPYHGWTYGADGALRGIGFAETYGEVDRERNGLIALPVEERHGFVWVVEDPTAMIDVAAFLGREVDGLMRESGLAAYACARSEVLDLPQNWKIMADGLLDGYHVKFLHGDTISPYVHHNIMAIDVFGRHTFQATPRTRISEIAGEEPGASPLNRYCIFSIVLAPNSQLVIHPHHTEFWTFFQNRQEATRCRALLRILTPRPVETDEGREVLDKNYKILIDAVMNEDIPAGNGVQRSAAMPAVRTVQLGRNEVLNQMFHTVYERLMEGRGWKGTPEPRVFDGSDLVLEALPAVAREPSLA
jgi:phenylpropionate dioxygenase-like ring-hydroxylating dioxygenase large terminal subunit